MVNSKKNIILAHQIYIHTDMNALEQARNFILKTHYANFFRIMRKNIGENVTLSILEKELLKNRIDANYEERLMTFLETEKDLIKTPLPDEEKKEDTIFLTNFVYQSQFIGREKELENLHTNLQDDLPTVVVNGLGGIGKTTLAREYINRMGGLYDHIVWLEQAGKPLDAFVNNIILTMELGLTFQNETIEQRFEMIRHKLRNITGKNLLVLDNYQQDTSEDAYPFLACFPFSKHWRVLFTSREQIASFTTINIDTLLEKEAIALFKMHCTSKNINDTELKSLLQDISYHTLMTEILAKVYQTHTGLQSIADFAGKIQARAIDDEALQRMVRTAHSKKDETLYKYLLRIFDFNALPAEALHLLRQIAVLSAKPIEIDFILRLVVGEEKKYRLILEDLAKKGWISLIDNKAIQMHRLIQLLILQKYEPTYQDCTILDKIINNLLSSEEVKANPLQWQWLTSYGESLLQYINYQNSLEKKASLQNELASLYTFNGNYAQALPLFEDALRIRKEVLGEKHFDTTTSLNNIAMLYKNQGNYAQALPLYEQALQIRKEILGEKHPNTATSLNNIATLYQYQNNYAQALSLFEQALQIRKEVLGEKHPDTAMSLNNIAMLYKNQDNYAQALPLFEEALQIWKEVLGEKHPYTAISLNNIANIYYNQGNYVQALPLFEQALQIQKEVLGEKHPNTISSLNNIGMLYFNMQQYDKAKSLVEQSYQIWQEVLGEEHPQTQIAIRNLAYIVQKMQEGENL